MLYIKKDFFLKLVEKIAGVFSTRLADFSVRILNQFAEGLEVFKSPRDMFLAIFFSLLTWTMPIIIFYATLKAFNIDAPWYTPFVMQSILSVFIAVPGAPGPATPQALRAAREKTLGVPWAAQGRGRAIVGRSGASFFSVWTNIS